MFYLTAPTTSFLFTSPRLQLHAEERRELLLVKVMEDVLTCVIPDILVCWDIMRRTDVVSGFCFVLFCCVWHSTLNKIKWILVLDTLRLSGRLIRGRAIYYIWHEHSYVFITCNVFVYMLYNQWRACCCLFTVFRLERHFSLACLL